MATTTTATRANAKKLLVGGTTAGYADMQQRLQPIVEALQHTHRDP